MATGNKFWGGSSSSSDSSDSDSEEEVQAVAQQAGPKAKRWAEESSSEEEEEKRVVRSHKDKRYDDMKNKMKELKNHQKIEDFANITKDYEDIFKMLAKLKSMKVLGAGEDEEPPKFFVKAISSLQDFLDKKHKDIQEKKQTKGEKLPENKAKAFNTLRAKVRKGNKEYEEIIKECLEDPSKFQSSDESEEEAEEDSDSESEKDNSGSSSGSSGSDSDSDSSGDSDSSSGSDSDSDSDSSSSNSSSGSSGSSKSDEQSASWKSGDESSDSEDGDEEAAREKKMLRWLITPDQLKKREAKEEKRKEMEEKRTKTDKKSKDSKADKKKDKDSDKKEKSKSQEPEEYSEKQLTKKVSEIAQKRGRRGFDKKAFKQELTDLQAHAQKIGPRMELQILCNVVSADFDNTGSAFEAMKINNWNDALVTVNKMLPLLVLSYDDKDEGADAQVADSDDPDVSWSHARIQELFVGFVEKLDDELYKALQFTVDVYNADYQDILGNSSKFLVLLKRVFKFFEDTKQTQALSMISLRLLEQLYYKPDVLNGAVYDAIKGSDEFEIPEEEKDEWIWPQDSRPLISKLVRYVFSSNQSTKKLRASLCQVYHLALHDYFQPARDLLQLRQLNEAAVETDVHTQILYNRVLAQMGLCAFRLGKIADAHNCLMEVCMHNKARELLAQGLSYSKNMDRTPEQERLERLRQLPYHMHINLDVLDSAHHICAMMLEVPNMAMQSMHPSTGRPVSRVLRRELDKYERQQFNGPPETPKEAVVSAAKAVQCGDWAAGCNFLEDLKIWDHIDPGNDQAGAKVKAMIKDKIKIEALRTYLFSYASIYDAFQLEQLREMFDLEAKQVHSTVSKMMIKEEITAFWDEDSKFLLMQHSEPTPLQRLALTLADKGASAVDANEKMLGQKTGQYGFADRDQQQQGGKGRWDQGPEKGGGQRRFGKGGPMGPVTEDRKGGKGKGRGKGMGNTGAARSRGWENARAGASQRGGASRGGFERSGFDRGGDRGWGDRGGDRR